MSEDNSAEAITEEVADSVEVEAAGKGWSPDKGDKTAQEFLDYEEDYSQRKSADRKLQRENKELHNRIGEMEAFQSKTATVQRGLVISRVDTLKINRDNALASGQGGLAKDIQTQLDREQKLLDTLPPPSAPAPPAVNTDVITSWSEQNPWIEDGSEKAQFAQDLFQELNYKAIQTLPANAPQSVIDAQWRRMLRQIDKETSEEFGEVPANKGARKKAPCTVKGKRSADEAVSTRSIKNLRSEDKKMYKLMVKSETNPNGTHNAAQFFKDLDKANAKRGVV